MMTAVVLSPYFKPSDCFYRTDSAHSELSDLLHGVVNNREVIRMVLPNTLRDMKNNLISMWQLSKVTTEVLY
jgi:hypothetical protein